MTDLCALPIIEMENKPLKKCRAIVRFGPEMHMGGMSPAQYYQAIIDPDMVSPSGSHIRFGGYRGDELVGWQRVDAMTVCEILAETPAAQPESRDGYVQVDGSTVTMRCVIKE